MEGKLSKVDAVKTFLTDALIVLVALFGVVSLVQFEIGIDDNIIMGHKLSIVAIGAIRFMLFITSGRLWSKNPKQAKWTLVFSLILSVGVVIYAELIEGLTRNQRLVYHLLNLALILVEFTVGFLQTRGNKTKSLIEAITKDRDTLALKYSETMQVLRERESEIKELLDKVDDLTEDNKRLETLLNQGSAQEKESQLIISRMQEGHNLHLSCLKYIADSEGHWDKSPGAHQVAIKRYNEKESTPERRVKIAVRQFVLENKKNGERVLG